MFRFRLQALRQDNDLTQEDLATALNLSRTSLTNYEAGIREPSIALLIKIADYFNVSIDYLVGRTDALIPYDILGKIRK